MSYHIQLYRTEVMKKYLDAQKEDFFENEENILPFTLEQKDYLKNRLLKYSYFIENEKGDNILFGFEDDKSVSALLTNNCLSFSATGEGIFEISMTSSEFTDNEEFKKFDPQNGGWEEI